MLSAPQTVGSAARRIARHAAAANVTLDALDHLNRKISELRDVADEYRAAEADLADLVLTALENGKKPESDKAVIAEVVRRTTAQTLSYRVEDKVAAMNRAEMRDALHAAADAFSDRATELDANIADLFDGSPTTGTEFEEVSRRKMLQDQRDACQGGWMIAANQILGRGRAIWIPAGTTAATPAQIAANPAGDYPPELHTIDHTRERVQQVHQHRRDQAAAEAERRSAAGFTGYEPSADEQKLMRTTHMW